MAQHQAPLTLQTSLNNLDNNPITDLSSLCHADIQKLKSFWVADIQPENSCFSIAEIIKTNTSKLKMISKISKYSSDKHPKINKKKIYS